MKQNDDGQATVELALLIPVLAIFLLLILQVGVVVRQHMLVANASREAARELSVDSDRSKATARVLELVRDAHVSIVRPSQPGEYLSVTVHESVPSNVPLIGIVFPDVTVSSSISMRVEK